MTAFAAIDFETANHRPDSACAVGIVIVRGGRIVRREHRLIRPPDREFVFTSLHGIAWDDVSGAPAFCEVWPDLEGLIADVAFLAAHNAPFDRRVLEACCRRHRLRQPPQSFVCTVQLSRRVLGVSPARLSDVCRHLAIPLRHHEALSDAEACARIVIAAGEAGWQWPGVQADTPRQLISRSKGRKVSWVSTYSSSIRRS